MKVHQIITETPLSPSEEKRFLSGFRKEIQKTGRWPSQKHTKTILKSVSPKTRQIGKGATSVAYGRKGSDTVIKISKEGADAQETLEFLRWAKQQKNPHLPKVYNIQEPHRGDPNAGEFYAYVRMERLQPLNIEKFPWSEKHVPFLLWMQRTGYDARARTILGSLKDLARKRVKNNALVNTLNAVSDMAGGHLDIRLNHNLMVRPGTDDIVIVDPY